MKRAVQQLKESRKRRNPDLRFDLTVEDVWEIYAQQAGKCAFTDFPMENYRDGKGTKNPYNISIDRIDPRGDYVRENIQLVCYAVNMMKGTMDDDTFRKICTAVGRNSK